MSALLPDGIQVRWWGHSTFAVTGPTPGQKFLFDPFLANNPRFPKDHDAEVRRPGAFDALVITHPHYDHFRRRSAAAQGRPETEGDRVIRNRHLAQGARCAESQTVWFNTGGTIPFNDVRITMVAAVHSSSVTDKGGSYSLGFPVGYVLRFANGFTIYNTGDTAVTMDMQIVRDLYRPNLVIPADRRRLHHGSGAGGPMRSSCCSPNRGRRPLAHMGRDAAGHARRPRKGNGPLFAQDESN